MDINKQLKDFDWFNFNSSAPATAFKFEAVSIMQITNKESILDRKLRMLRQLSMTCTACSMCELGLQPVEKNGEERDPHVFSSMTPSRIMILGQNPGFNEVKLGQPFVGAAGKNFDNEIIKHGLSRSDFYITNTVRCYTKDNQRPSELHKSRCEPFLMMEINLLRPMLIVCLGSMAFSQLCPDSNFSDSFFKITKSIKYGVNVYPIYHPSPLNFAEISRFDIFKRQIEEMCKLVKAINKKYGY